MFHPPRLWCDLSDIISLKRSLVSGKMNQNIGQMWQTWHVSSSSFTHMWLQTQTFNDRGLRYLHREGVGGSREAAQISCTHLLNTTAAHAHTHTHAHTRTHKQKSGGMYGGVKGEEERGGERTWEVMTEGKGGEKGKWNERKDNSKGEKREQKRRFRKQMKIIIKKSPNMC